MATKNEFVLPQEYDGQVIDVDDYLTKRRENALANSRTRTEGYVVPNTYKNCIATATDNYGNGSFVTGNHTFYASPEKYGFRRLKDGEPSMAGDIVQAYTAGYDNSLPYHSYIINELDDQGNIKNINYANGEETREYHVGSNNHWAKDGAYRYRYIGTPAELAAIQQHNEAVRAANAASAQYIPTPAQAIPTKHITPDEQMKKNSIFDVAQDAK